jgi:4-hydroxybenzoate polyprenyltransferase
MRGLLRAAHAGPALAVVVLATGLAVADDLPVGQVVLVASAVLAGQLTVGWSNDLIDEDRDRTVARTDKPLVSGTVARRTVLTACALAAGATVVLSLACGLAAGLVHLACVASALAYNLGLKSTVWSWLPYAFSFGGLVVFVSLVGSQWPPWWVPVVGGLLGVGAHLVNALPDLADDDATGVRGLPHRLGPGLIPPVATVVLVVATVLLVVYADLDRSLAVAGLVVTCILVGIVLAGRSRAPFVAAVVLALTDVVLLLLGT